MSWVRRYLVVWEPLPRIPGLPNYQFRPTPTATFRRARQLALTDRGSRIYRASIGEPIPAGPGWSEIDNGYSPEAWT